MKKLLFTWLINKCRVYLYRRSYSSYSYALFFGQAAACSVPNRTTMQQARRMFGVTDGGHQLIGTAGEEEEQEEEVVRTAERSVR